LRHRAGVFTPDRAWVAESARDVRHAGHAVAQGELALVGARLDDVTREVRAQDVGKCNARERVAAGTCADVEQAADAHRTHTNHYLPGCGPGLGDVLDPKHLRRTELVYDGRFHLRGFTALVRQSRRAEAVPRRRRTRVRE